MRELDPVALARDIAQTLDIPWELSSGNSPTLAPPNPRRHVANRVLRHRRRRCLLPELGTMSVPSSSRCRYDDTLIALVSLRCPGHPGGTATGSESSTRALPSNTQGGKEYEDGFRCSIHRDRFFGAALRVDGSARDRRPGAAHAGGPGAADAGGPGAAHAGCPGPADAGSPSAVADRSAPAPVGSDGWRGLDRRGTPAPIAACRTGANP